VHAQSPHPYGNKYAPLHVSSICPYCVLYSGSAASRAHDNCHVETSVGFGRALLRVYRMYFFISDPVAVWFASAANNYNVLAAS